MIKPCVNVNLLLGDVPTMEEVNYVTSVRCSESPDRVELLPSVLFSVGGYNAARRRLEL